MHCKPGDSGLIVRDKYHCPFGKNRGTCPRSRYSYAAGRPSGCLLENRKRFAPAKLSEGGKYRQPYREDLAGWHGLGGGEVFQHVAAVSPDTPTHFVITGLLATVLRGKSADERAGGNLAVHARDGRVQHGQHA